MIVCAGRETAQYSLVRQKLPVGQESGRGHLDDTGLRSLIRLQLIYQVRLRSPEVCGFTPRSLSVVGRRPQFLVTWTSPWDAQCPLT